MEIKSVLVEIPLSTYIMSFNLKEGDVIINSRCSKNNPSRWTVIEACKTVGLYLIKLPDGSTRSLNIIEDLSELGIETRVVRVADLPKPYVEQLTIFSNEPVQD
jgi:hypothetical protein